MSNIKIINSKCKCGEPILIETGRTNVSRRDGKRPHYLGSSNTTTQMRCRKCLGWLAETCSDAAFNPASKEPSHTYDLLQISHELRATALGEAYHGNAVYVARDIPCLTCEDKIVLSKWLDNKDNGDTLALHAIANRVKEEALKDINAIL